LVSEDRWTHTLFVISTFSNFRFPLGVYHYKSISVGVEDS
jgi:hypothetical protein